MTAIDLTVIRVENTTDLPPQYKSLDELPASGTVYVYQAPTLIGGREWKIIARVESAT